MRSLFLYLKLGIICLISLILLPGCEKEMQVEREMPEKEGRASEEMAVVLKPSAYVDSAQVFFFRGLGDSDTLIRREVVYDIEYLVPHTFHFQMPAGKYTMWVLGNVPTDCIVMKAPYSSNDIIFDYSKGRKPGAVCYGKNYLNFGVDTLGTAGMLLLASSIELNIQKVPDGISGIIVQILNTASGIVLGPQYIETPMDPPLADTLRNIQRDSSYVSSFYCFPGVGADRKSTLVVDCYDEQNEVVFSGRSAPFLVRYGYKMLLNCSFALTRTAIKKDSGMIYFTIQE